MFLGRISCGQALTCSSVFPVGTGHLKCPCLVGGWVPIVPFVPLCAFLFPVGSLAGLSSQSGPPCHVSSCSLAPSSWQMRPTEKPGVFLEPAFSLTLKSVQEQTLSVPPPKPVSSLNTPLHFGDMPASTPQLDSCWTAPPMAPACHTAPGGWADTEAGPAPSRSSGFPIHTPWNVPGLALPAAPASWCLLSSSSCSHTPSLHAVPSRECSYPTPSG